MIFLYFWIWHNMIIFLVLSCTLSKDLCTLYILFKEEIVIVFRRYTYVLGIPEKETFFQFFYQLLYNT